MTTLAASTLRAEALRDPRRKGAKRPGMTPERAEQVREQRERQLQRRAEYLQECWRTQDERDRGKQ